MSGGLGLTRLLALELTSPGVAAAMAASITHPLDLTKVRLQATGDKGMIQSMRKTIHTAGECSVLHEPELGRNVPVREASDAAAWRGPGRLTTARVGQLLHADQRLFWRL